MFNGSTRVYSNSELTTPAVSGEYAGETVEVEGPNEEPIYGIVSDFIVADGIITEELEPEEPEDPEPLDPEEDLDNS